MRMYLGMFRMRLIAGLQYRAAAWAGVATQFFFGFVFIMVFKAFYESSSAEPPMPMDQMVCYQWLRQAFLVIFVLWIQDNALLDDISSGNIAYELTRPLNLYRMWFARLTAQRISAVLLRCMPILAITFLMPAPYNMTLPPSLGALGAFLLSLCLGLLLVVVVSMFIYMMTMRTLSALGPRLVLGVAAEFMSGVLIPIPMMPDWLQRILNLLPFRYIADLPLRLYSGHIPLSDAGWQMAVQVFWIVSLGALGMWSMQRALRRVVIQGG